MSRRVWITVKSTLPEFAALEIVREPIESDIRWVDFFRLKQVTQFNSDEHVVSATARGHIAFGDDQISNTAQHFRRDHFAVTILRHANVNRRRARARNARGGARGARSLINVHSLVGHGHARPANSPIVNGAAGLAGPSLVVRQNNQPGGRGGIRANNPQVQQPSTAAAGVYGMPTGTRGRGRGRGRIALAGSQRGNGRQVNPTSRQASSASSVASSGGTMNSLRAAPPTPRASQTYTRATPHTSSSFPEDSFPNQLPQNNVNERRIYAESIDSEAAEDEENPVPPVTGTNKKSVFLQLAARVPAGDFDVFYKEILELKAKKKPGTDEPDDSFWRWSKKTPSTSHFLQMAMRIP